MCAAQILALLAMEQPVTLSADDIRDEKVRVSMQAIPRQKQCRRSSQSLVLHQLRPSQLLLHPVWTQAQTAEVPLPVCRCFEL